MTETYDLVAIGSGPAGESATELAAFFGHRAAVIERVRPGGAVTTTGGVPSKTLREAALYLSGQREGGMFGLRTPAPPEIAIEIVRRRTWEVCEALQKATVENIARNHVDYIEGAAQIQPDGSVKVTGHDGRERRLRAKTILIATGSRPRRPKNISFDILGVCDTDTLLYREQLPKDILIVGGGPIAVEFATICHALGARVTIVNLGSRLLPAMDGEIAGRLEELLQRWGVTVLFGSTVERVVGRSELLDIELSTGEKFCRDTVLFAAGRIAHAEDLGLDGVGVLRDSRGRIVVDANFQTNVKGIYAAGDVLGSTLASIATEQGRAAVCHAFRIPFAENVDPAPASAVYGIPELSGAGLTEEQCRERCLDYEVGRADLAATPRGAIAGSGGLLKLIFQKGDRKLVGVHCLGDIASEIVGIGQTVIRCGGNLNTIANLSMNTPTYSYAYKDAARDGLRRLTAIQKNVEFSHRS